MTHDPTLPFVLPERHQVTQIRQRDMADLLKGPSARTQPLAGYDAQYGDIVDYIVRITEEIWRDRSIGRIYDTYDANCTIYGASSVVRSVEEVVAATLGSLNTYPDQITDHVNIAWRGDEKAGFYTSHLGYSKATNLGPSEFGPATGKRVMSYFVADCVSRDNRIHTEWLMHDSGAMLHYLGVDLHETAQQMATVPLANIFVVSPPTRLNVRWPQSHAGRLGASPFRHDLERPSVGACSLPLRRRRRCPLARLSGGYRASRNGRTDHRFAH